MPIEHNIQHPTQGIDSQANKPRSQVVLPLRRAGETPQKSEATVLASPEHPGGYTIGIPSGLKPGETFTLSGEVDASLLASFPKRIREHIQALDGSYLSQFNAVILAKPQIILYLDRSQASKAAIEALAGQSFMAFPSRRKQPTALWAGMYYRGLDQIQQFSQSMRDIGKQIINAHNAMPEANLYSHDERLAAWMQKLQELQLEEARITYEQMMNVR